MVTPDIIRKRQTRLEQELLAAEIDALALNPGASLVYLTGLHFHLMERPFLMIFTPGNTPSLVLPELEARKVDDLPFELNTFEYGENPSEWHRAFRAAAEASGLSGKRVGVETRQMRLLEMGFLEEAVPDLTRVPSESLLARLRMYKDEAEVSAMRRAAYLAERALQETLPQVRIGMDERELAGELVIQLLRQGANAALPFAPIVAAGPNSANPHASPSERRIRSGDLLLFDWGASSDGYFSDITRTFAVGEVEPELARIAAIVQAANTAARKTAGPGVPASRVDQAARDVITRAGYGPYFTHRTGHGLGMEGHEEPYIRSDSDKALEPGMTFTIEPGIYLPGRGGVRIEDDVLITKDGMESFTIMDRELIRLL